MKPIIYILTAALLAVISTSCNKCEQITLQEGQPIVPIDTACKGIFYSFNLYQSAPLSNYQVDSFSYPKTNPANISLFDGLSFPLFNEVNNIDFDSPKPFSDFSYDNDTYVYALDATVQSFTKLYVNQVAGNTSTLLDCSDYFMAPEFLNGTLYGIEIQLDAGMLDYEIKEINTTSGAVTTLHTRSISVVPTTELTNATFSSCNNGMDKIYFLSHTGLIEYSPGSNSSIFYDIDTTPSVSMRGFYQGVEYQPSTNSLLAIKGSELNPSLAELVRITPNGATAPISTILDLVNLLNADNDGRIDEKLYTTTYSRCDNTYHIAESVGFPPTPETFLIDIMLNDNTVQSQRVNGIMAGLEIKERQ